MSHPANDIYYEAMADAIDEQKALIREAEERLGIGPVELSRRLETPYDTLKDWKSGRREIVGSAKVAIELMLASLK